MDGPLFAISDTPFTFFNFNFFHVRLFNFSFFPCTATCGWTLFASKDTPPAVDFQGVCVCVCVCVCVNVCVYVCMWMYVSMSECMYIHIAS